MNKTVLSTKEKNNMPIKTTNFDQYFSTIQNQKKVGELENAPGKVTQISEYKSPKSGKTSLKLTIDVDGSDVYTYLGYSNEKSIEISKARLVKLCIAAIGMDGTKKIYEEAANDEDVSDDKDLILEIATRLNKKLKKTPVDVIVTRTKSEDGFWDTKWFIPDDNQQDGSKEEVEKPSTENTEDFLKDLAN